MAAPSKPSNSNALGVVNAKINTLKANLKAKWDKTINEDDGSFEYLFGDPSATPFAVLVRVYFDEKTGDTCVDIVSPADGSAFSPEESLSGQEKKELEGIIQECSDLLDSDIPAFGNTIYSFLQSFESHPSLRDDDFTSLEALKVEQKQIQQQEKAKKMQAEKEASKNKELKANQRAAARIMEALRLEEARQRAWDQWKEERLRQEAADFAAIMARRQRNKAQTQSGAYLEKRITPSDALQGGRLVLEGPDTEESMEQKRLLIVEYPKLFKLIEMLDREYANETSNGSKELSTEEAHLWNYMEIVLVAEQLYFGYQKQDLTRVPNFLRHLVTIQEINLSENRLTVVPAEIVNLPNLKRLFLHTNYIKFLPPMGTALQLELFDIHNNQLSMWPEGLEHCSELKSLDAERNRLPDFGPVCQLKRLNYLNLSYNRIRIVPGELHTLEKSLVYLRLKNNPIVNLPVHVYLKGMFATLEFLKQHTVLDEATLSLFQPHTIRHDLYEYWSSHSQLCDLKISLATPDDPSFAFYTVSVHSLIVSARLPSLRKLIGATMAKKQDFDSSADEHNITLTNLSKEDLALLLKYAYSDQYDAPEVPQIPEVSTSEGMTTDQRNLAIAAAQSLHSTLIASWRKELLHQIELTKTHQLPYLQFLVEKALGIAKDDNGSPASSFLSDLSPLLFSESSHDVAFRIASEPHLPLIYAHKAVLCARSPYLTSLLTGGLLESTQSVIEMQDISYPTLKAIIEFCYTDDVVELEPDWVMELLMKSRLFGIDRLLAFIQSVVGYSLDAQNVCGILITAALYSLAPLAKATKFFVLTHWNQVTADPSWNDVSITIKTKLTETARKWGVIDEA